MELEIPDIELIRRLLHAHREQIGFTDALLAVEHRLVDLRAQLAKKPVSQHNIADDFRDWPKK